MNFSIWAQLSRTVFNIYTIQLGSFDTLNEFLNTRPSRLIAEFISNKFLRTVQQYRQKYRHRIYEVRYESRRAWILRIHSKYQMNVIEWYKY